MISVDRCDIAVIGAGASGLAAAIEAARENDRCSIVLLEKGQRVGQKILVTGNGRCNLGNENTARDRYFGNDLYSVIEKFGDVREFFSSLGLMMFTDEEGRIYPYSNQASSVLNVLRAEADMQGIEERCGFALKEIRKHKEGFCLTSETGETVIAGKVIVAVGSPAGKKRDDNGALYLSLEALGHKLVPFSSALVPLLSSDKRIKSLKGVRARAEVVLIGKDGKEIRKARGEVQFADGYLGGICVMDLSVSAYPGCSLKVDLCPELSAEELAEFLYSRKDVTFVSTEDALCGVVNKNIAILIAKENRVLGKEYADLSEDEIFGIAESIKALSFAVTGTADASRAQVCCGGIAAGQVDKDSLESLVCPGMYFCGEILGVAGDCGGFNLTFAWASGRCAGSSCATAVNKRK